MLNFNVRTDILFAVCRPVYGCWSARLFWRWIYKLQLLTVTPRVYRTLMLYHIYLATGNVIHTPLVYHTVMFYHVYLATGNAWAGPGFPLETPTDVSRKSYEIEKIFVCQCKVISSEVQERSKKNIFQSFSIFPSVNRPSSSRTILNLKSEIIFINSCSNV